MSPEIYRRPVLHPYTRYFGFGFILRFTREGCQPV